MFQLLLISPPEPVPHEHQLLKALFDAGLTTFHLRKPGASVAEVESYLQAVPREFHSRIMLHQHHALAGQLGLRGVHLPAAARAVWEGKLGPGQRLSTSLHSLPELAAAPPRYDYVFLSPIFDSISKAGYRAGFELAELRAALQGPAQPLVLALGGVDAATLPIAQELGFAGAAVLGAVWQQPNPVAAFRELQRVATARA
ncbi:thiamine phosphate synthase [Hymenobacter metallicola]|uniref:Thiamine phosphate synthase n=1 Tax=Hymenobacter metallicola TaxID=2563114 RepID=A0A4Z0QCW1_9BACT|nr:thiamine phosphate synthase [Hymenobacter metallicola]TGE27534.1 thiamine phosphate synthase [Hymenobacter metallicola]